MKCPPKTLTALPFFGEHQEDEKLSENPLKVSLTWAGGGLSTQAEFQFRAPEGQCPSWVLLMDTGGCERLVQKSTPSVRVSKRRALQQICTRGEQA